MPLLAKRMDTIQPSPTLAINNKAIELKKSGIDVISLSAGEPDFDTPDNVKQAATRAMERGFTKYTAVEGMPELRKAVQEKFRRDNNLEYGLDEIIISAGGKQVIFNAFMASIEEGGRGDHPCPLLGQLP